MLYYPFTKLQQWIYINVCMYVYQRGFNISEFSYALMLSSYTWCPRSQSLVPRLGLSFLVMRNQCSTSVPIKSYFCTMFANLNKKEFLSVPLDWSIGGHLKGEVSSSFWSTFSASGWLFLFQSRMCRDVEVSSYFLPTFSAIEEENPLWLGKMYHMTLNWKDLCSSSFWSIFSASG